MLRAKLAEMELHDDLPDSADIGYMDCWRDLSRWLDAQPASEGTGGDDTGERRPSRCEATAVGDGIGIKPLGHVCEHCCPPTQEGTDDAER